MAYQLPAKAFYAYHNGNYLHFPLWATPSTSPCPTYFADTEPAHIMQHDVTKSALASPLSIIGSKVRLIVIMPAKKCTFAQL